MIYRVNVSCKRLGGGFGAKIDRCNIVATAAALAANKVHKPVRISLGLQDNMTIIGWREPYLCTYKVSSTAGILFFPRENKCLFCRNQTLKES